MLAQQQQQFQPGNHNVFDQNPNMYPPTGNTQRAFLPNDETQAGMQQNLKNVTPQVANH